MAGDQLGRLFADVADSEAEQQPGKAAVFAPFNCLDQVIGRLLLDPFKGEQLLGCQPVQPGAVVHQPVVHQQVDHRRPQPLDVHRVPAGKMDDAPFTGSRAGGVDAADDCLVRVADRFAAADRAGFGDLVWDRVLPMADDLQNFGDDLPRLPHQQGVADADPLFGDKVLVVQGRPADRGAGQGDAVKDGGRRQGAGAADLDFNIPQDRFFFFRWVFEGHRPAGELDGRADLLPEGEVVDFDNSTVDIKVVLPSPGVD